MMRRYHSRMKTYILFLLCSFQPQNGAALEIDSVKSLLDQAFQSGVTLEDGVTARVSANNGRRVLEIGTRAAPTKGPAAYLATVRVKPGQRYTYFVKAYRRSSCRVLHYIISPEGNVVWPGADVEEGVSHTTFTVPPDVTQITLALAFLYPEEEGSVLVEDIALVEGETAATPAEFGNGLESLLHSARTWMVWLYGASVIFLLLIFYFTGRGLAAKEIRRH